MKTNRRAAGVPIGETFRKAASSRVGRPVQGPFRLHAVFQPNLDEPLDTPVLEPLVLDDVTVVYRDPAAPLIIAWSRTTL